MPIMEKTDFCKDKICNISYCSDDLCNAAALPRPTNDQRHHLGRMRFGGMTIFLDVPIITSDGQQTWLK